MSTPDNGPDGGDASRPGTSIDTAAQPRWRRTGDKHFPYAPNQSGHWWILRANYGFPEHDMYTLFIDDQAVADITAEPDHRLPLLASIGALHMTDPDPAIPFVDDETVSDAARQVAKFANYGSEHVDPCLFCSRDD